MWLTSTDLGLMEMDFCPLFCLILALGLCNYFPGNGASGTCEFPSIPSAPSDGRGTGSLPSNTQYIIPTMNFTGCGEITDWTIEGQGTGDVKSVKIELQLFRPDPTRSTVFTEVTSSIMTTSVPNNVVSTHTLTSIGFTFSPGDVLGFYYPNNMGGFLEVRHTNSFSTHSVLTLGTTPTASIVTATAPAGTSRLFVPLMSVSVSCMECPRSNTITGTLTVSQPGVETTTPSSSSGTASAIFTTTNSIGVTNFTGIPTPSNTADSSGSDIPVGVPIAVVLVPLILAVVVAVVIIVIVVVSVRRKNSGEVSLRDV